MLLWTWNWFYFVNSFMFFNFFTYYFCLCFMKWYLLSPYKYYNFYDIFFSPLYACSLLKFLLFIFIFSFHSRLLLNIWCFICFKSREFLKKNGPRSFVGSRGRWGSSGLFTGVLQILGYAQYAGVCQYFEKFSWNLFVSPQMNFPTSCLKRTRHKLSRDRGGSESWAVVTCLSFAAGFLSIERGHGARISLLLSPTCFHFAPPELSASKFHCTKRRTSSW